MEESRRTGMVKQILPSVRGGGRGQMKRRIMYRNGSITEGQILHLGCSVPKKDKIRDYLGFQDLDTDCVTTTRFHKEFVSFFRVNISIYSP